MEITKENLSEKNIQITIGAIIVQGHDPFSSKEKVSVKSVQHPQILMTIYIETNLAWSSAVEPI